MCNAPIFMHSKQVKKTTVPHHLHTISTHFSTNLTPDPQKNQKSHNSQIADD